MNRRQLDRITGPESRIIFRLDRAKAVPSFQHMFVPTKPATATVAEIIGAQQVARCAAYLGVPCQR